MQLSRIETISENMRLLDKIANKVLDQKVAAYCTIAKMELMVYMDHGIKRRASGYKLIIITKTDLEKQAIRLILDNHNEESPIILTSSADAATTRTEELVINTCM